MVKQLWSCISYLESLYFCIYIPFDWWPILVLGPWHIWTGFRSRISCWHGWVVRWSGQHSGHSPGLHCSPRGSWENGNRSRFMIQGTIDSIRKPKDLTQTCRVWNVETARIRVRKGLRIGFYQWWEGKQTRGHDAVPWRFNQHNYVGILPSKLQRIQREFDQQTTEFSF